MKTILVLCVILSLCSLASAAAISSPAEVNYQVVTGTLSSLAGLQTPAAWDAAGQTAAPPALTVRLSDLRGAAVSNIITLSSGLRRTAIKPAQATKTVRVPGVEFFENPAAPADPILVDRSLEDDMTPTSEPAALLLTGSGLLGTLLWSRRKQLVPAVLRLVPVN